MKRKIPEFKVYKNNYGQIDVSFYEEDFQNIKQFYKLLEPILQEIKLKYTGYLMHASTIYSVGSHLNDALDNLVFLGSLGVNNNGLWAVRPQDKWVDEADYMDTMMDKFGGYKNKSYKDSYECKFINPCLSPPKIKYLDLDAAPVKQNPFVSPPVIPEELLGVFGTMSLYQKAGKIRFASESMPMDMNEIGRLYKVLGEAIEKAKPKVEVDDDILI